MSSLMKNHGPQPVVCFIIEIMRMTDVASSAVYVRYSIYRNLDSTEWALDSTTVYYPVYVTTVIYFIQV